VIDDQSLLFQTVNPRCYGFISAVIRVYSEGKLITTTQPQDVYDNSKLRVVNLTENTDYELMIQIENQERIETTLDLKITTPAFGMSWLSCVFLPHHK